MEKINLILADDHLIFRTGLKRLLHRTSCLGMMSEAENGQEVLDLLEEKNSVYHIVLLDIQMPVMNGIDTLITIRKKYPEVKVIMLSMHCDEDQIDELYENNMDGYLNKTVGLMEIQKAMKNVMDGGQYFSPEIAQVLYSRIARKHAAISGEIIVSPDVPITEREKEILELICEQYSSEDISEKLDISIRTVGRMREILMVKTGARNIAGLVLYAIKNKLYKI